MLVSAVQQRGSAIRTHISLHSWAFLPPTPSKLLGHHRAPGWASVLHSCFPRLTLHMVVYTCQRYFLNSSRLSFPYYVQKSVLYVCVSIPTLKICSSVPFFYSPYICINIIFYSFWLTSFYMINTRFIHITTNDPVSFLSVAEQCVRWVAQSWPTLTLGYHGL